MLGRPSVPEKTDGDENGASNQCGQSILRLCHAAVFLCQIGGPGIRDSTAKEKAHDKTNSKPDVGQSGRFAAEAVLVLEDAGESGEAEVGITIDGGGVGGQQENDGGDQHLERAKYRECKQLAGGFACIQGRPQVLVPGLLAQPCRLPLQDHVRIRLVYKEDNGDGHDARGNGHEPEVPSPARGRRQVPADDGPNSRSQDRAHHVRRHGGSAFLAHDHVCDRAGAQRARARPSDAGQQSVHHQRAEAVRHGARDVEDDEQESATPEHDSPSVQL